MDEEEDAEEHNEGENNIAPVEAALPVIEDVKYTAPLPSILKYLVD